MCCVYKSFERILWWIYKYITCGYIPCDSPEFPDWASALAPVTLVVASFSGALVLTDSCTGGFVTLVVASFSGAVVLTDSCTGGFVVVIVDSVVVVTSDFVVVDSVVVVTGLFVVIVGAVEGFSCVVDSVGVVVATVVVVTGLMLHCSLKLAL